MPLPEQVGKPPPNASCRQSFVMGGTQAPYCVGPPGLERHRTTSQAQVLSDAIAGADDTDAPTRAAANARFKAFIAISLVNEIHAHITERKKGKPKKATRLEHSLLGTTRIWSSSDRKSTRLNSSHYCATRMP